MNKTEASVSLFTITFFAAVQYAFLAGVPDSVSHFAFLFITGIVGFLCSFSSTSSTVSTKSRCSSPL